MTAPLSLAPLAFLALLPGNRLSRIAFSLSGVFDLLSFYPALLAPLLGKSANRANRATVFP